MTVNAKDLPTNNLNINEIEQNTSPNSLELGLGEERKPSQFVLGKDARLLYQSMLEKIVDAAIRLGIPLSLVAGTHLGIPKHLSVPVTTASYSLDELAGPVLCEFTETSI